MESEPLEALSTSGHASREKIESKTVYFQKIASGGIMPIMSFKLIIDEKTNRVKRRAAFHHSLNQISKVVCTRNRPELGHLNPQKS